jgi:gliding motility-associated-like protein
VTGTWDLGGGIFEPYSLGTTPSLSYASAGQFTVTLIVENVGGCSDTSTVSICILPADPTFIPDIFSPNGDGNNDVFFVRGRGIIELDFRIYNRFGQQVFRSTNASVGWDGTQGGKPMPSGSYVYSATIKLADGTSQDAKGEVTLIR